MGDNLFTTAFMIAWLVVAVYLAILCKVGAPATLRHAPARRSQLSLVITGLVILLYLFCVNVVAGSASGLGIQLDAPKPAELIKPITAATATSAATTPATSSAASTEPATTLSQSPPAPATTSAPALSTQARDRIFAFSIVDAIARLLTVAVCLAFVPTFFSDSFRGIGLHPSQLAPGIFKGLIGFLIIFPVLIWLGELTSRVLDYFQRHYEPHPVLKSLEAQPPAIQVIGLVLTAVVVAPIAEEFIFRGILQTAMIQRGFGFQIPQFMPPSARSPHFTPTLAQRWFAILISSLLFTAVHTPYDINAPIIFPLALALGYVYERTGTLFAPITLHALFNGIQIYWVLTGTAH